MQELAIEHLVLQWVHTASDASRMPHVKQCGSISTLPDIQGLLPEDDVDDVLTEHDIHCVGHMKS